MTLFTPKFMLALFTTDPGKNKRHRNFPAIILTWMLMIVVNALSAQIEINTRILDSGSKEPLAFVAVLETGSSNGAYSDIDGYVKLTVSSPASMLSFHYVGYQQIDMKAEKVGATVLLKPLDNSLNEVVILPGVNPAERIIRAAIDNKKKNDPEYDLAFTYDSYNKLVFGGQLDSTLVNNPDSLAAQDSSTQEMYDFFNKQYLFLIESIAQRKFLPPDHSEETIIANRVSGLKSADFFLLATQLQSFSFYGETVNILGNSYMSPLADGAIKKYLFVIEDTTYIGKDSVFTISFRPRKGKNFVGMKGQLFINTNGFALQNVLAEPAETGGFYIKIQQQYQYVENRKWFPEQLNSFFTFPNMVVNNVPIVGEGRSYVKNLKLDAPLERREFTPVTLLMAKDANNVPDSVWNKYRDRELATKELETYRVIDSVGQAENLDLKLKVFESLMTGQVPIGPVNFELARLMRYNNYEGYRLGGGLRTNYKLSEKFSVGGYYAYGFRDKHSKYGGDVQVHLYRKRNAWVRALYENDVMETGGNQFARISNGGWLNAGLYPFFISRMDRREKKEIQLNARVIGNLTLTPFANQQFVETFHGYEFERASNENVRLLTTEFDLFETGFTARFAPGEKLVRTQKKEVRLFGYYPVFWLKYTKGWDNTGGGDFAYNRFDMLIEKTFRILNVGDFTVMAVGGMVAEDVPLSLLYNAQGTNNLNYSDRKYLGITSPGSFETMRTNEFQHSQFVAVHLRHNFKDLLLKTEHFKPRFIVVHNMLWGKLDHAGSHNLALKSATKGYYESGLQVDNLYSSGFSSFGLGFFYNYGPYHQPDFLDNFAVKLSTSLNF